MNQSLSSILFVQNRSQYHVDSAFSFTGKERDEETGYSYFGARYYDADLLTGWVSVDPMADKYPSISPYAYCAWNPVKLVDPDGQDIWLVNKNGERIKYQVGMSNEGLDKYTSETILALNRLVQTKTIGLSIFQLSNTTYVSLEIIESEETSAYIGVDDRFIKDNYPIINFNPYLGIMSCKTNEILSPAACLGYELGHIFNEIESPKDFYMRRQTFCDDGWSQMEDFYTITN